jgi:hypothetical protein
MKVVDWNIVCKSLGKQLNLIFLLGAIASAEYFLADAFEKLGFSIFFTSFVKGIAIFSAVYFLAYALILTKKFMERFY